MTARMNNTWFARAPLAGAALVLILALVAIPADAGDAYFKGGIIFAPRDVGFEGRWRLAFGADYPVNFAETVLAGFELQTSVYRQDVAAGGPTATIVPGNAFFNVKYKSSSLELRPFAGGGLGLVGDVRWLSSEFDWNKEFGYHLLGGIEFGRLVLELQMIGAFESGVDIQWAGWVGFVW
jgi:hypothetical protein